MELETIKNPGSDSGKDRHKPSVTRQYLGLFQGLTAGFQFGSSAGYVSVGMDSFQREYEAGMAPFEIRKGDVGTFASAMQLGGVVGALLSLSIARRFGRRWPGILLLIPYALGWGLIAFPQNFLMMVVGNVLCGIAQGCRAPLSRMYLAELSHPSRRGQFLSSITMAGLAAQFFVSLLALLLDWRGLALTCGVLTLATVPLAVMVPESHVWLITRGRNEEAKQSLQWFYGPHYNVDKDFEEVVNHHSDSKKALSSWKDLCSFKYLNPVFIVCAYNLLRHFSGSAVIIFFASQTLRQTTSSLLDVKYSVVILGAVQLVFVNIAGVLMDKVGRRRCIILSAIWMGISEIAVGAYFYVDEHPDLLLIPQSMSWLPLFLLCTSMIGCTLGLLSAFNVLVGEIIPMQIKNEANAVINVLNSGSLLVSLVAHHFFLDTVNASGAFWIYSASCFLIVLLMVTGVPETRNKTLGQIERELTGLKRA